MGGYILRGKDAETAPSVACTRKCNPIPILQVDFVVIERTHTSASLFIHSSFIDVHKS